MEHATPFTPFAALAGGLMIGAASVLLLATNGRVAGISGIVGALFSFSTRDHAWRLAFIVGLLSAPIGWMVITGAAPQVDATANLALLITAGRSLAAVLVFMAAAAATVFVTRHIV